MPGVGSVNDRSLHAEELVERREQVVAVDPRQRRGDLLVFGQLVGRLRPGRAFLDT